MPGITFFDSKQSDDKNPIPTELQTLAADFLGSRDLASLAAASSSCRNIVNSTLAKKLMISAPHEVGDPELSEFKSALNDEDNKNVVIVLQQIQRLHSPIPRDLSLLSRRNRNLDAIYVKQNLNNLSLTELLELYKEGVLDDILVQVCQNPEIASVVMDTSYLRDRLPAGELQIRQPTFTKRVLGMGYGLLSWVATTAIVYGAILLSVTMVAGMLFGAGVAWPFYAIMATVVAACYLVKCLTFLRFAWRPMDHGFFITGGDINMSLPERRQYCLKHALLNSIGLPLMLVKTFVIIPLYELCRYISYGYQAGSDNFSSLFSVFKVPQRYQNTDAEMLIQFSCSCRSAYPCIDNTDNLQRSPTSWYQTDNTIAMRALESERHRTRTIRARLASAMDISSLLLLSQHRVSASHQSLQSSIMARETTPLTSGFSSPSYSD